MKAKYVFFLGMMISFLLSACNTKSDLEDITHFSYQETENGKWGIMDTNGKIVVQPMFQEMPTPVSDDMFFVPRKNGTYELRNIKEPEKIIDANYTGITYFFKGRAFVTREGEAISCIDKKGNTLYKLPSNIKGATGWSDNSAAIINEEAKVGYIDATGKIIIPCQYWFGSTFKNSYAMVMKNPETAYIIDKQGNRVVDINEDNEKATITSIVEYSSTWLYGIYNGIIPYVANGGFGLKNIKGEVVMPANEKYKKISRSYGGYCGYQTENGCGIMDDSGKILIKDKYDLIGNIDGNNKTFTACIDNKWGILSMNEEILCPFEFDLVSQIINSSYFIGQKNKKLVLMTKRGEVKAAFHNVNLSLSLNIKSDI